MKPLELHIYEKHQGVDGASGPVYRVGGSFTPYIILAKEKRFSDAELAAEWHRSVWSFQSANDMADLMPCPEMWSDQERDRGWMYAMERFATLPHFDA